MTMTTNRNHRIYDAIAYEDALDAAERRDLTTDERDAARRFVDSMRAQVLHKQRMDRMSRTRIRPSILAMALDAVVKRLEVILEAHPDAVFAHRDLKEMSEHDLRTALEDAETFLEKLV
jgi:hypothetical protein